MRSEEDIYLIIEESAKVISSVSDKKPATCIVLGSGLSGMAEHCKVFTEIRYEDIPHFSKTTAPGHSGMLVLAEIAGTPVYLMKGRFHYYEGYEIDEVTFPYRVLASLGVRNVILTNAAGGINKQMKPGELMVITDHLSMFCQSPLRGINLDRFGPRFPDQSHVYNPDFVDLIVKLAQDSDFPIHTGVYAYMKGPQYETPAEIRALQSMGADAVGMSTVPDAIVASHCGMRILAISCITNLAAGISDSPLSHSEVILVGSQASERSIALIESFIHEASL